MFKEGDIVVRINNAYGNSYPIGDIGLVMGVERNYLEVDFHYLGRLLPDKINIRLATSNEILAYNRGIRNINNIKENYYEIY